MQSTKMRSANNKMFYAMVFLCLLCGGAVVATANSAEKVRLRDVSSLVFSAGVMTEGRRSSPIPQMTCEGGYGVCKYRASSIGCLNVGWDGNDVNWKCEVNGGLDPHVRLGKFNVNCEGYEYPTDPFVLKGSCGISYELERTNYGRYNAASSAPGDEPEGGLNFFGILVVLFLFYGLVNCLFCDDGGSSYHHTPRRSYSRDYGSDYGTGFGHGFLASSFANSGSSSWGRRSNSSSWGSSGGGWGSSGGGWGSSSGYGVTTRR